MGGRALGQIWSSICQSRVHAPQTHQSLTVSSQEADRKQSRRTTFQATEYTSWRCSSKLLSGFACGGADKSHTCGRESTHTRAVVVVGGGVGMERAEEEHNARARAPSRSRLPRRTQARSRCPRTSSSRTARRRCQRSGPHAWGRRRGRTGGRLGGSRVVSASPRRRPQGKRRLARTSRTYCRPLPMMPKF